MKKILVAIFGFALAGCVNNVPKQSPTISAPFPNAPKSSNQNGNRLLKLHLDRSTKAQEVYLNCNKTNASRLALSAGDPMALAVEAELKCSSQRNTLSRTFSDAVGPSSSASMLSEAREDATRFNYVLINKIRNAAISNQSQPEKTLPKAKPRTYSI